MAPKKGRRGKHVDDDDEESIAGPRTSVDTEFEEGTKPAPAAKKTSKKKQVNSPSVKAISSAICSPGVSEDLDKTAFCWIHPLKLETTSLPYHSECTSSPLQWTF